MDNRKSYWKGLLTGIIICVLLTGTLVLTGCFGLRGYLTNGSGQATENNKDGESDSTDVLDNADLSSRYSGIESKLNTLQSIVDSYYLNDTEIDADALEDGIYKGYIDGLDETYTTYYTAAEYTALQESTSGTYSGIGVVVQQNRETGVITVIRPFENAPGYEAGIRKDDILYKVAGNEVTAEDVSTVVSWIKGEEGTTVDIEVYRPSENEYIDMTVERRAVEVPTVEHRMLENNIGYIEITEFDEPTAEQFDAAVEALLAEGMKGLIVDVRDNPGGLLTSVCNVLDRILPKDDLLVYTVDKNGSKDESKAEDSDTLDIPITVLMNGNSASAAEIFSGALQDYGVAQLVGTTSFGKGIVQVIIPLNDGSAVKLTTSKYYTPNGRNIHGTGLDPDIEVEADADDNIETDDQLNRAITVITEEMNNN